MDYEKLVKKEFKFLKRLGFKLKNYTRNFEIEIDYLKDEISIGINYVSFNNEVVGCGIQIANKSENLLKNTLFNKQNTDNLNKLILQNIHSAENQIKIYAQFIFQNIDEILKW